MHPWSIRQVWQMMNLACQSLYAIWCLHPWQLGSRLHDLAQVKWPSRKVKTETQHVWHLSIRVYYLVSLIIKVHVRPRRHELEKGRVQTPLRSKWPSRQAKPIYRQSDSQKAHMIPSFPSLWKPSQVQRPSKLAVPQQTLK